MAQATLQQIAEVAGCSPSVVSSVLNKAKGNTRVSAQLRERILSTAQNLNYRPNFAGRSLRQRTTRTIGFYVMPWRVPTSISHAYENGLLRGVEAACRQQRFSLLILNLSGQESPEQCIYQMQEQRIDGLVMVQFGEWGPWALSLLDHVGQVVVVGSRPQRDNISYVGFDNAACMDVAIEHMTELGHTRIAYAGACLHTDSVTALERRKLFLECMQKRNLDVPERWVFDQKMKSADVDTQSEFYGDYGHYTRAGRQCVDNLFSAGESESPTGIISFNDEIAAGVIQRLHEMAINIPGQVSVMGIDNSDLCSKLAPPLTSIDQPLVDMGYWAGSHLITCLSSESVSGQVENQEALSFIAKPKLLVRRSTLLRR